MNKQKSIEEKVLEKTAVNLTIQEVNKQRDKEIQKVFDIIEKIDRKWQLKILREYSHSTPRDLYIEHSFKDLRKELSKLIKTNKGKEG